MRITLIIFIGLFIQCQPVQYHSTESIDPATQEVSIFAPGIISRQFNERDLTISPDGNRMLFTLGNHNHTKRTIVFTNKTKNGSWSTPAILPFSGRYNDIEPFFHPNDKKLFFASNRPISPTDQKRDYNLWAVTYTDSTWGEPVVLPSSINTDTDEFYPAVALNGNLYFTATYSIGHGKEDIFVSEYKNGQYSTPTPLDTTINSATYEFNAYVSPDEQLIIFSSFGRSDGLGGGDLYLSQKDSQGKWAKARHLDAPINSVNLDFCPFLDFRAGTFYFTSQRDSAGTTSFSDITKFEHYLTHPGNGMGDLYHVKSDVLHIQ